MSLPPAILLLATLAQPAPDTLVVVTTSPPVWGPDTTLVKEARIGVIDGASEYTFGEVSGVALGADGVLWVADGLAGTIGRFAADGSPLGDVGRMGEGPGDSAMEWREPLVVDVLEPPGRRPDTLTFPDERTTLGTVTEDVLWAVVSGDYDEQYVVRYRITPG